MTAWRIQSIKKTMEGINQHGGRSTVAPDSSNAPDSGIVVTMPERQSLPVVLASPHSGSHYPRDFAAAARLDPLSLRLSEDCFVDEIFSGAAGLGAPLIKALFPRAYIDVNREPFELDPGMFADPLPDYVNTSSPRVAAGLGTVARIVSYGQDIYRRKLTFAEALERINRHYKPYHSLLGDLITQTRDRFGYCILIDCHSMPSGNPFPGRSVKSPPVDFVLGDAYGQSCAASVTRTAELALADLGYNVLRNSPYAGGHTTRSYGRPEAGVHALQIEINRALYMDERALSRKAYILTLADHMTRAIARIAATDLKPE